MEDVAVDAGAETPGTPPESIAPAESETPSVDAQAGTEDGDAPVEGQDVDPLTQYLQSKGIKPEDRTALHDLLRKRDNDNGSLSKRIKDLEAQLTQRVTPAQEKPEAPPEPHPDIKSIDEYISTLKAEKDAFPVAEAEYVRGILVLRDQITEAKFELRVADDLDKPNAQRKLDGLEREAKLLQRQLDLLPRDKARVDAEIRRAERDRQTAQRAIEADESARQEAGERHEQWRGSFLSEVDSLIPRIADELKLPADANLRGLMVEDVKDGLTVDLWKRADANISDVNVQELIRARVDKWAKKHGLVQAVKLAQVSKEKAPVAGKPNGTPPRTATPPNSQAPELSIHERMAQEEAARIEKLSRLTGF